jgi:hypothetical protein
MGDRSNSTEAIVAIISEMNRELMPGHHVSLVSYPDGQHGLQADEIGGCRSMIVTGLPASIFAADTGAAIKSIHSAFERLLNKRGVPRPKATGKDHDCSPVTHTLEHRGETYAVKAERGMVELCRVITELNADMDALAARRNEGLRIIEGLRAELQQERAAHKATEQYWKLVHEGRTRHIEAHCPKCAEFFEVEVP